MISGSTARHVGVSIASPADNANVRPSSMAGDMSPAIVVTARAIAIPVSVGISCASGQPAESSGRILTARRSGPLQL